MKERFRQRAGRELFKMRWQRIKGMDRVREAETEGQKERLTVEWMRRRIQEKYRKREMYAERRPIMREIIENVEERCSGWLQAKGWRLVEKGSDS